MRIRKTKPWKNNGEGIQVYDVVYEVDKLDFIKRTEGKSDKYDKQHKKAVNLVTLYNLDHSKTTIKFSKCREILQTPYEFFKETVVFYNEGKIVASNKEVKDV